MSSQQTLKHHLTVCCAFSFSFDSNCYVLRIRFLERFSNNHTKSQKLAYGLHHHYIDKKRLCNPIVTIRIYTLTDLAAPAVTVLRILIYPLAVAESKISPFRHHLKALPLTKYRADARTVPIHLSTSLADS